MRNGDHSRAEANEVAKGYRGEELKLVNDKDETIGRIDEFIFSQDDGASRAALQKLPVFVYNR